MSDQWKDIGKGFTAACLSNSNDISATHYGWNCLTLNWERFLKVLFLYDF